MTKADIVEKISDKTGIEKQVVMTVVEAFMKTVRSSMILGHNVYLRGFGTFLLKKRREKKGRNISKNTSIVIPAHYTPSFKPCDQFQESVREKVTDESLKLAQIKD